MVHLCSQCFCRGMRIAVHPTAARSALLLAHTTPLRHGQSSFQTTTARFRRRAGWYSCHTLVRLLGRGGLCEVWLARDEVSGREVALKFVPEPISGIDDICRVARCVGALSHPRIVRVYDFLREGGTEAVSMEYVAGESLASRRSERAAQVYQPRGADEVGGAALRGVGVCAHAGQDPAPRPQAGQPDGGWWRRSGRRHGDPRWPWKRRSRCCPSIR